MSYILDALKKIEHEKNRKTRPDGRVSISGDLFQEQKQPAARSGIWKLLLLVAAAALVTFAGTWFLLQGSAKKSPVVIQPPVQPPAAAMAPQAAQLLPPVPVQPQSVPVAVPAPAAAPSAAVPVTPNNKEAVAENDSSARVGRRSKKRINAQSTPVKQPAQTMPAPADIKLSGIAWQEERAARRAVVNGFLLKEGAVVSGARITDIQADRVRFSSSAGQFEIKLDAVLPTEVRR